MMFVQETKMESIERITVKRIWGGGDMKFASLDAVGASGGLLVI